MPRLQNVQSVWNDVGKILKQNNFHYNVPCDEQEGNYQGKMSPVKMSFGEKRGVGLLCEQTPPAVQQTVSRHQTKTIKLQGITFKLEYSLRGSVRAAGMTRSFISSGDSLILWKQTLFVLSNFAATVFRLIKLWKWLFKSAGLCRQKNQMEQPRLNNMPAASTSDLRIFCQKSKIECSRSRDMIPGGK